MPFIILYGDVQSGKTTFIQQHIAGLANVYGILTPDVDGRRKLITLSNSKNYTVQVHTETDYTISIGKFIFDTTILAIAQQEILNAALVKNSTIIIDEIGKLEILDRGLEPAITKFIKNVDVTSNLIILLVRNTLVSAVIEKYNLHSAIITTINNFTTTINNA